MGEVYHDSGTAWKTCGVVPKRFYDESRDWYKSILREHFPEMFFSMSHPLKCMRESYRLWTDKIAIHSCEERKEDTPERIIPSSFLFTDEDVRDKGKKITIELDAPIVELDASVRTIEDYFTLGEKVGRQVEERRALLESFIKRRDFLRRRGYDGKYRPTSPGFFDPHLGSYEFSIAGDGSKEKIERIFRDFLDSMALEYQIKDMGMIDEHGRF